MNTPSRWCAAGIAGVLAISLAASAAEPVIDIPNEVAQGPLQETHRQQIDKYVAYQVDKMAKATSQDQVIAARRKLADSYNRYGSKALEFMSAFAASVAERGKAMLAGLAADDPLRAVKEVNLSIAVSRVGQASLGPLANVMVSHANPAVRYFGWIAYAAMRVPVMAAGGNASQAMYNVLSDRLRKETNPQVLAELLKMFTLHDRGESGGAITPEAYLDGLSRLFKILETNWVSLCRGVMQADGAAAEGASTAVDAVVRLKNQLKGKVADQLALQLVANMTWSAGKAFDLALGIQEATEAAKLADKAAEKALAKAGDENLAAAAKEAADKALQLAQKLGKDVKTLGSQATRNEYAVSTITKLLQDCEGALNALTVRNDTYIIKPLSTLGGDRAAAVRLGVLKWIDEQVKAVNIKRPEDVVPPKEPPATKEAPATKEPPAPK
jgi:hypothetical protein